MRIGLVIHGNLRTFLMPTREDSSVRICDLFMRNVVEPNDADVFAFTDTSDFYLDGVQYYAEDRKVEILNNNAFRIHTKVDFMEHAKAQKIIVDQLSTIIGPRLKDACVERPYDATTDPKFKVLYEANVIGSSPALLVHQWRKLKLGYEMLKRHETEPYDAIVKWRFDIHSGSLSVKEHSLSALDVFVAGMNPPIIYDWYAFGNRKGMDFYMNLYDHLGFMLGEGRVYMYDCPCGRRLGYGNQITDATHCGRKVNNHEVTLAPEYHLFQLLHRNGVKVGVAGGSCPYRYKPVDGSSANDALRALGLKNCTLVNYTAGRDVGVTEFKE